jgi:hypothetical protein
MAFEQTTSAVLATITPRKIVTHPYFSMVCALSVLFILPRYGSAAVMVGCAGMLSAYVMLLPDRFRSRSGSLTAAVCLVTAMWIAAAVIAALTLMGGLQD